MSGAKRGFTLIELLIVIGIIGFLAAAVLVAVDPVKRIQDARDSRRFSEANALLNAVLNKQVDDRKVYNGPSDAPIITHATQAQVIVTAPSTIDCDAVSAGVTENFPGCHQALNTTARVSTGSYTSIATKTITGTGTNFTTAFRVGDDVREVGGGAGSCIVQLITSDTVLECVAAPSPAFTASNVLRAVSRNCVANISDTFPGVGTATNTTNTINGTNTNFSVQVSVGDTLTSANTGNPTCVVTAVTNATTITCAATPGGTFSGAYTITLKNPLIPNYVASAPVDPRGSGTTICSTGDGCTTTAVGVTTLGTNNTGYYVHRTTGNRLEVGACSGEQATGAGAISVKR